MRWSLSHASSHGSLGRGQEGLDREHVVRWPTAGVLALRSQRMLLKGEGANRAWEVPRLT